MRVSDGEIIEFYESTGGNEGQLDAGEDVTCASCGCFAKSTGTTAYLWLRPEQHLMTALLPSIELCDVCNERIRTA